MNYSVSEAQSRTRQMSAGSFLDTKKRHKIYMFLGIVLALALGAALTIHGWNYYILDQAHRPFSPKHAELKASGTIGLRLGELGVLLFALVYIYPLRKRWSTLSRVGETKHWLDFHILLALMASVVISFHCAFKMSGFAGMAYWTMVALTLSGVVGRYFYAQIPRRIGDAEMSLKEMQETGAEIMEELGSQEVLQEIDLGPLFRLPDGRQVQSMSIFRALSQMLWLDIQRPFRVWSLRRRGSGVRGVIFTLGGILPTRHAELERAISLASKQASLAKKILFLSKTHRVFHLWHVVHRPFSFSFAILVIIHVAVVMSLGYF